MYRTVKTHELVLKGIPDSLRAEIWLIFSGAVTEVDKYSACKCNPQFYTLHILLFISFTSTSLCDA